MDQQETRLTVLSPENNAQILLDKIVQSVCERILRKHELLRVHPFPTEIEQAFQRAIDANLTQLAWAAKHRPSIVSDTRVAKARLRTVKMQIENAESIAINLMNKYFLQQWAARPNLMISREGLYPDVPEPTHTPEKAPFLIPPVPGIYFLWSETEIEYIGKSEVLSNRLKLGMHHILNEQHKISFLVFEKRELTWAECYYIGSCRPKLNFGKAASHYPND